jgi:hypothetical protein
MKCCDGKDINYYLEHSLQDCFRTGAGAEINRFHINLGKQIKSKPKTTFVMPLPFLTKDINAILCSCCFKYLNANITLHVKDSRILLKSFAYSNVKKSISQTGWPSG